MPVILRARLTATGPMTPSTGELHYLACSLFESGDANACHAGQDKPFSIWPLRPAPGRPGRSWVLQAAWLRPDPPADAVLSPDKLTIGRTDCAVDETMHRTTSHAQLATSPALKDAALSFSSPTYFAHNGGTLLNPDPRRIAQSWRRSWNAWLPETSELRINDDTWLEINRSIELVAFELRTTTMDSGHEREQPGFVGSATLRLNRKASMTARSAFSTLARFADFSGTGAQTTHGFGATRMTADAATATEN